MDDKTYHYIKWEETTQLSDHINTQNVCTLTPAHSHAHQGQCRAQNWWLCSAHVIGATGDHGAEFGPPCWRWVPLVFQGWGEREMANLEPRQSRLKQTPYNLSTHPCGDPLFRSPVRWFECRFSEQTPHRLAITKKQFHLVASVRQILYYRICSDFQNSFMESSVIWHP